MASVDSATFSDIERAGSGFSFTGNMAKYAVNDEWVEGYNAAANPNIKPNSYTSMWNALSSGTEDVGNDFYKTIRNYIDDIGNIDTCGIEGLLNYADILGVKNDYLSKNTKFPIEIQRLVEIFSVNPAYLYNKSTDGSQDTLTLSNSILHYTTVERYLAALKDKDLYEELVNNVFYNTIMEFLNLKTTTFDDSINGNEQTEIWKTDVNRFLNRLWNDDITSDEEVYSLKEKLGVDKSFTEKIYADDIMAGRRKLSDFSDIEQTILKVEMKSRETRYGDSNAMRYYYMRLFKVVEYFRFATIAYNNAYRLEKYALNDNQYSIESSEGKKYSLLKFNYSEYEIDTAAVKKVSTWLTNLCFGIRGVREDMKTQCRKNMMVGTKRLIVDIIRKFILEKIDSKIYGDVRNAILYSAGLNKKFGVSIIEYSDMTEYFNIENSGDAVKPSDYNLHSRYWEMYDDIGNSFDNNDVLSFYNRLFGDSKKFVQNSAEGSETTDNLYEFLSILFEAGAVGNTNSDYYLSSDVYEVNGGSTVEYKGTYELSDEEKDRLAKYSGDMTFADAPYANHKNTFHPSYQLHPFVQAFEEYNEAYTSIMNLVNSYTENITESYNRLKERLDSLGNTMNFWYNWNDDFSGYSTTYEKGGSDFDIKSNQDGPFNFEALQEFLSYPSEYINNILNGLNKYYYDASTGKALLSSDEIRLEVGRLQKYATQISLLSNKEIYKYGKDCNGNIYILYKESGKRRDRTALGDVWVRLRNHPIAFPLFDLSLSPVRFSEMSCLAESDNTKLLSVLTKVFKRFASSYGFHHIDDKIADGDVISEGLTLTIGTYSETVPVMKSGNTSSYEFSYGSLPELKYGNFRLVEFNNTTFEDFIYDSSMGVKTVYEVADTKELSGVYETYYFRDSVTDEDIGIGDIGTTKVYHKDGDVEVEDPNPTGKIVNLTYDSFFKAEYDEVDDTPTLTVSPLVSRSKEVVVFADYEDVNAYDGKTYYCYNSVTGKTHSCSKRIVRVKRIVALPYDAFKGAVEENGNVRFGGELPSNISATSGDTPFSNYDISTSTVTGYDMLDGGRVYEDFNKYSYTATINGINTRVNTESILILGGNNPFYLMSEGGETKLIPARIDGTGISASNAISFSDGYYRNNIRYNTTPVSSVPFSACEFAVSNRGRYVDSIGQFYIIGRPYERFYPYTSVVGVPIADKSKLNPDLPYGTVTIHGSDGDELFYYNINSVGIRRVYSEKHTATVELTSCKFGGSMELIPYDKVEYPISLDFSMSSCGNTAVYSSYMSEISQQKFFDMGFSYNQKLMYLSYADDKDSDYLKGGTIVGKMDESYDGNYSQIVVFHRDSSHNVEYVDSRSSFISGANEEIFHIGDISSKRGIFTAYGKYYTEEKRMEVALTLFSDSDVSTWKFGLDVRNGLFDKFTDGGTRYSFALSCTDSRLYLSFTTNPPEGNDTISTTVNGYTDGFLGTTTFDHVSSSFTDCMIQIVSFDITDDEVAYVPSETRYVLGGGDIGYLQQFGGMDGKSNIFSNGKMAVDTVFPIQPQFGELSAAFDMSLLHEYGSSIIGFSNNRSVRTFDRFINLIPYTNPSFHEVTGFLVEDDHKHAMLSTATFESMEGSSVEFESFDGRNIIDISRGLDGGGYVGIVDTMRELKSLPTSSLANGDRYMVHSKTDGATKSDSYPANSIFSYSTSGWEYVDSKPNHGVNMISDGLNTSNRCAAFIEDTTVPNAKVVNGKKMALMPIHSEMHGYVKVDFDELVDSGDNIYSLHSDGQMISVLSVKSNTMSFDPISGICEYNFTPYDIVKSYGNLPETATDGTLIGIEKGNDEYADGTVFRYDASTSSWSVCHPKELDRNDVVVVGMTSPSIGVDGYTESATIGGRRCYGVCNGRVGTWFGAFNSPSTVQTVVNTIYNAGTTYASTAFLIDGNPAYLAPSYINNSTSGGKRPYVKYVGNIITKGDVGYNRTTIDSYYDTGKDGIELYLGESLVTMADTSVPTTKMFNTTLGYVYKYDALNGEKTLSHVFDALSSEIADISDFQSVMSETTEGIIVSYWSENGGFNGVLRTRKTTPDSVGTASSFKDGNGYSVTTEPIVKFISCNGRVLAEERGGHRIFLSTDDGITFTQIPMADDVMHLFGCGTNRFYARYGNGEKVYSTDGLDWVNATDIHASKWSIVNASGVDYLMCSEFDEDLRNGTLERSKFVSIEHQMSVGDGFRYTDICVGADGAIACVGGMDGNSILRVARFFRDGDGYSKAVVDEYPYVNNMAFSSAHAVGGDLVLSPEGGMTAISISHVFDAGHKTDVKFIDLSSAVNNEVNIFGGFGYANGRVIMYPSVGTRILTYDTVNEVFHCTYAFDEEMTLCDCDIITSDISSDAILSPRTSTVDGKIKFSRTAFNEREDFGIIEIDEGLPIAVGYSKVTMHTADDSDGTASAYKLTFMFANDVNGRSVSIISKCFDFSDPSKADSFESILADAHDVDGIYIGSNTSMKYSFSCVDDTPKFTIRKEFPEYATNPIVEDVFRIDIMTDSHDDTMQVAIDYTLQDSSQPGKLWVYGEPVEENGAYSMELD